MNLVRAELARLAARRFVQLMVVLLLGAFAVTVATTVASSHRPSAAEVAEARELAAEQRARWQRSYERCLSAQRDDATAHRHPNRPHHCQPPIRQDFAWETFLNGVFIFEREIKPMVYSLIAFLALFGFLVGASYVGADMNSGGMTNLLLWRPKRVTVLGAKLGTLLGAMLVGSLVAAALYLGTLWTVAQRTGLTGDLDGDFWPLLGLTGARGLALVLGTTALGFAIATLGRHTAAALGVIAGYLTVWEIGARIVLGIVEATLPDRWMLSTYLAAWMEGRIQEWGRYNCSGPDFDACTYTFTWVHAAAVLGTVVGGFVLVAFVNFHRRDLA